MWPVIEKANLSFFNSGNRIEDHFVDATEMIEIGKGGQRPVITVLLSRYACYLAIQNDTMTIVEVGASKPVEFDGFKRSSATRGWNWNSVSYTHLRAHETRHDLVC